MGKGEETRERILAIAQEAVLAKGFTNTSIDEVRTEAGLTKSGFLYHFPDKTALAKALLLRYVRTDDAMFDDIFERAATLHSDPLHSFLIALQLLAEVMTDIKTRHPGCVVAAVAYHDRQFNAEIRQINKESLMR
jgi:AcrR family transcriptional regulator